MGTGSREAAGAVSVALAVSVVMWDVFLKTTQSNDTRLWRPNAVTKEAKNLAAMCYK
jgi:hypothetical protein